MPVSTWDSLTLVNAVIGFCVPDVEWVDPLFQCGYAVGQIEPEWAIRDGARQRPTIVCPDLTIYNPSEQSLFAFECKVGTVQGDQLGRYERVSTRAVVAQGAITNLRRVQVAYVTTDDHADSCELSLADTTFPLLVFRDDMAYLRRGTFLDDCLQATFTAGVPLRGSPPRQYLPLDGDSSVDDAAAIAFAVVIGFARRRVLSFDVRDVLTELFGEMLPFLNRRFRNRVEVLLTKGLHELARPAVMGPHLRHADMWRIDATVAVPGGVSVARLRERVDTYLNSLGGQETLNL